MKTPIFQVIDPIETGKNIVRLRQARGLRVRDVQAYFGFEEPQAIYKWQRGQSLPTLDNLYALAALLEVSMDEILVSARTEPSIPSSEQQTDAVCCSPHFFTFLAGYRYKLEVLPKTQAKPCSSLPAISRC